MPTETTRNRPRSSVNRMISLAATALAVASITVLATPATAHPSISTRGRTGVPWQRVGPGWTVATWSAPQSSVTMLWLIGPRGALYKIANVGKNAVPAAWSPDGSRVVLGFGSSFSKRQVQVNLRTGARRPMSLPNGYPTAYTRPSGASIIENVNVQGPHGAVHPQLQRLSLDGHLQRAYPRRVPGAGVLDASRFLQDSRGRHVLVGAEHGIVMFRKNGTISRLRRHASSCAVESWWRAGVAVARCGRGILWAVPTSGARPWRLTGAPTKADASGYTDIWRDSRGRLGLAASSCGPEPLVRFGPRGNGMPLTPPSPTGAPGTAAAVGHYGNVVRMMFKVHATCALSTNILFDYNPVTNTSKELLGGEIVGGTVMGALEYPSA